MVDYKVGDEIRIISMPGDPQEAEYIGRTGIIKSIDSIGQLHGTWGGLAIIPGHDEFEVLGKTEFDIDSEIYEEVEDPLSLDFENKLTEAADDKEETFGSSFDISLISSIYNTYVKDMPKAQKAEAAKEFKADYQKVKEELDKIILKYQPEFFEKYSKLAEEAEDYREHSIYYVEDSNKNQVRPDNIIKITKLDDTANKALDRPSVSLPAEAEVAACYEREGADDKSFHIAEVNLLKGGRDRLKVSLDFKDEFEFVRKQR